MVTWATKTLKYFSFWQNATERGSARRFQTLALFLIYRAASTLSISSPIKCLPQCVIAMIKVNNITHLEHCPVHSKVFNKCHFFFYFLIWNITQEGQGTENVCTLTVQYKYWLTTYCNMNTYVLLVIGNSETPWWLICVSEHNWESEVPYKVLTYI